ncbi:tetratricopeptide repeat protein, partial [Vibrio breoganii]|uniref:tetratricopeptide repeat protein n=2 Tax=Vibrio breoganii TaxID=553239 RepID=UPI0035E85784
MSHVDHLQNYYSDLFKAQHTPLLVELSHDDINAFSQEKQITAPLLLAKTVFDRDLKNQTSIILIDGDDVRVNDQFFLLERLLEQLRSELKEIKNLAVLKESLKGAASVATGGMLGDLLSNHLDNGLSFVLDEIGGEFSSLFTKVVLDNVEVSEQLLSNIEGLLHDSTSDTLGDLIARISKQNLFLSVEAKSELNRLSSQFSKSENIDLFQLAFKLLLAIAINSPKLIYVNNPHRLDNNSIAILSLLFSYAKNQKEQDQHIGLSVVYAYSDPLFDLYQEVTPELTIKQQLLSDQRRFIQRYSMLERPSSDIPNLAVKSSLFIGRQEELHTLNRQYVTRVPTTLSVISGEPGIGKTALVNQHITTITKASPAIVLTLLNEVGHSSSNTGLSSLEKSIIEEEKRLHHHRDFKEKTLGFLRNLNAKETVYSAAGLLASGADKALNIIDAGYQRIQTDDNLDRLQEMGMHSLDNKRQDEKERQFNKLDTAITLLTKVQIEELPIILFIDDLQWIDDTASEYILTRLLKRSDVYLIATLRPSDAATQYKAWQSNFQLHRHALSLLTAAKVTGALEFSQTPEAQQLPNSSVLQANVLTLSGFDIHALTQLIANVISGTREQHHQLAESIVRTLGNGSSTEVNTLFAVETINMLCDAKLYQENRFGQLILNGPLRFNPSISDLSITLEQTFESLQRKYRDSLVHASQTGAHQGFNLMAYAVLEERLHLLKIYFGEMGNAAVNSLLFSSLLGAPFSSELVKCVLTALSTTNEPKLKPLKAHITQQQKQVNLQPEHYAIIDEVYEILRRLSARDDQYQYGHGLLHIFLDKQFDYLLDSSLTDANQASKDALIHLISETVHIQFKELPFFSTPTQALTTEQTTSLIFHQTVMRNVKAKGYLYHPDQWAKTYTNSLISLASSYKINNQLEKAISLEEQSLEICQHYYQQYPAQWAKHYTVSLLNLASSYKQNNQLEKAISLEEQSLDILQHYYQQNPDQWAEFFTTNLNNLADSYRKNNQLEKAIGLEEQSLDILKHYYQQNPDRRAESYTISLSNLATSYQQNNQLEKAIALFEQSLEIRQHYYQQNPDQWAKIYTTNLNHLAGSYQQINQLERAISLNKHAFEIGQHYYQQNSEQWAKTYIDSLNLLANSYQQNNQLERAISLEEQSLEISQHYYQQYPDQWAKHYTVSLLNLASSYQQNNQLEKAISLEEQSLDILQHYYQQNPDQWAEFFTTNLNNLADSYQLNNQLEKAIGLEEQSLEILQHYYQQNPDQRADSYTTSLSELANSYRKNNQLEKAIGLEEQSLDILQHYYQQNPEQWAKTYTTSLNNLATSYKENNQLEKAIGLEEQSLDILQHYYQQNPEQWAKTYTTSLSNLANSYQQIDQPERAISLNKHAFEIGQHYYQQYSDQWAKAYTIILGNLASSYAQNNLLKRAIALRELSLKISQHYYQKNTDQWAETYTTSLSNLANSYRKNNQLEKAIGLEEQSL